jgi:hypothetical protein
MPVSRLIARFIGDEAIELTPSALRMFQDLGMVEIGFISREFVRKAIKFVRNAPQHLLYVRLDGRFRQSPSVPGLCSIIG